MVRQGLAHQELVTLRVNHPKLKHSKEKEQKYVTNKLQHEYESGNNRPDW